MNKIYKWYQNTGPNCICKTQHKQYIREASFPSIHQLIPPTELGAGGAPNLPWRNARGGDDVPAGLVEVLVGFDDKTFHVPEIRRGLASFMCIKIPVVSVALVLVNVGAPTILAVFEI